MNIFKTIKEKFKNSKLTNEMKNILIIHSIISIFLGIYIDYILRYFKTKFGINNAYIFFLIFKFFNFNKKVRALLEHPTINTKELLIIKDEKCSWICPFGKMISIPMGLYVCVRYLFALISRKSNKIIYIINIVFLALTSLISMLLNLNSFIYLLPFIIVDLILIIIIKRKMNKEK